MKKLIILLIGFLPLTGNSQCPEDWSWEFDWALGATQEVSWQKNIYDVASDKNGNVYVAGGLGNDSLIIGGITLHYPQDRHFFLKFDSNGILKWYKSFMNATAHVIEADKQGNVYIAGIVIEDSIYFDSNTIMITGELTVSVGFIVQYNPEGEVVWMNHIIGDGSNTVQDIFIDDDLNLYCVGRYGDTSININGIVLPEAEETQDLFVAKYDSNGTIKWANNITSPSFFYYYPHIVADNKQDVYVAVSYRDYSDTVYVDNLYSTNDHNDKDEYGLCFVHFNKNGNAVDIQTYGGLGEDRIKGCAIDDNNNFYITGYFDSDSFYAQSTVLYNTGTGIDMFLIKHNENGEIVWATNYGNGIRCVARDMAIDHLNNIHVVGFYEDENISFQDCTLVNKGFTDLFFTTFNTNGEVRSAMTNDFGPGREGLYGVDVNEQGNVCCHGVYVDSLVIINDDTLLPSSDFYYEIFVTRIKADLPILPPTIPTITVKQDTLISSPALSYQWFLDEDSIVGANNQVYIAQDSGRYYVQVEDSNGCISISKDTVFVPSDSMDDSVGTYISNIASNLKTKVYPNPNNGSFVINSNKKIKVRIVDITGKEMYNTKQEQKLHKVASRFNPGIYFVQINNNQAYKVVVR